jgi:hypothetical protein
MGSGDGSEVSTKRSLVLAIRVSEANEPGSSGNWQASGPKSYLRRLPLYPSELRAHQADFTRVSRVPLIVVAAIVGRVVGMVGSTGP